MKIVMNASPLIFLTKLDLIDKLLPFFDEFVISQGVKDEIGKQDDLVNQWFTNNTRCIREIKIIPFYINAWDLGKGEFIFAK